MSRRVYRWLGTRATAKRWRCSAGLVVSLWHEAETHPSLRGKCRRADNGHDFLIREDAVRPTRKPGRKPARGNT